MENDVHAHLQLLELNLSKCLQLARSLDAKQYFESPGAGEWSVCQVLEHIIVSETGTLGYMMKKSSSGWETLTIEGDEEIQKGNALTARLQTDEKFKAPAILPEPPNQTNFENLEKDWLLLRQKLVAFVQSVSEEDYNKLVFKQPYAGMITLPKTISFLAHHMSHHIPQLESIIERIKR